MKKLTKENVTVGELWGLVDPAPYMMPDKDVVVSKDPFSPLWMPMFPKLKAAYDALEDGE